MMVNVAMWLLLARWAVGWYLGARNPMLTKSPTTEVSVHPSWQREIRLSVIVPARNEEAALVTLLASVATQTRAATEVIVIDDASSDDTASVARAAGVTVLQFGDPPAGWLGKPWACWQGAQDASGDVLVFVDADTVMAPTFLEDLTDRVLERPGLVSIVPFHTTCHAYEQASGLFNLVALMGVGVSSVRRKARATGAFGPCIAMRREDYERIDGHRGLRGEVLDDIVLARNAAAAGIEVRNYVGGASFQYRMYPNGLRQLIEGWSKNIVGGATSTPWLRLLAIAAWVSGLIEAGWRFSAGLVGVVFGGAPPNTWDIVVYLLFALQLLVLLRRVGSFKVAALVHPIATMMFLVIFVRSAVMSIRGEVTWKDRTIQLPRARAEHS